MTHIFDFFRTWIFGSLLCTLCLSASVSSSSSLHFSGFWSAKLNLSFPIIFFFVHKLGFEAKSTIAPCDSPTQRMETPSNTRFFMWPTYFQRLWINQCEGSWFCAHDPMFMISKTQYTHVKHCDVYVVFMKSPERCREHASCIHSYIHTYIHTDIHPHAYYVNELLSLYNIYYLFIKQRVNKNRQPYPETLHYKGRKPGWCNIVMFTLVLKVTVLGTKLR